MASARIDTYGNDLQYERINKDSLVNACIAAICASLATVNFGYALGFSAEAELFDVFNEFNGNNTSSSLNPGSNHFDIFAVSVSHSHFNQLHLQESSYNHLKKDTLRAETFAGIKFRVKKKTRNY